MPADDQPDKQPGNQRASQPDDHLDDELDNEEYEPIPPPPEALAGTPLRITERGEAILHRRCAPVTQFGRAKWDSLLNDMFTTMWVAEGCGLAANQVGVDAQLFVYDLTDEEGERHVGHAFNPSYEVVNGDAGEETEEDPEGCLSLPGAYAMLARPSHVVLTAVDVEGAPIRIRADGYFARCLQHETDHLHGRMYVDLLPDETVERLVEASSHVRASILEQRAAASAELGKVPAAYPVEPPQSVSAPL